MPVSTLTQGRNFCSKQPNLLVYNLLFTFFLTGFCFFSLVSTNPAQTIFAASDPPPQNSVAVLKPLLAPPAIANGGFESGFAGWTRADQIGSEGTFVLQTGTTSPVNGDPVPAPPQGASASMTDAGGPGSRVLYQDFVATGTSGSLSFELFIGNRGDRFATPATLDFSTPALNQQARVDILRAGADPFSVAPADILMTIYRTEVGAPLINGYFTVTADISALLAAHTGETLRLRFAQTDNIAPFQLGVDNVRITDAADSDSDGILDVNDNCPAAANADQANNDGDAQGDACDLDDDNDGDPDLTDCAPLNAAIGHGSAEICDGIDNNCNGQADEGCITTWYRDFDGDGFGNPSNSITAASQPAGYVSNNQDCNDYRTWYQDVDNDGWGNSTKIPCGTITRTGDCDDNNNKVHSLQTFYRDADGDSWGNAAVTTVVCSSIPPAGYVANRMDCNDGDKRIRYCPPPVMIVSQDKTASVIAKNNAAALELSAFPNPFGKTTRIQYTLPAASHVRIQVFDVLGREVGLVFSGKRNAGTYIAEYNSSKLSSGTYYCRMTVAENSKEVVQTQMLVK